LSCVSYSGSTGFRHVSNGFISLLTFLWFYSISLVKCWDSRRTSYMPQRLPSSSFATDRHSLISHCIVSVIEDVLLNMSRVFVTRRRDLVNRFTGYLLAVTTINYDTLKSTVTITITHTHTKSATSACLLTRSISKSL
jgi:hypothetical protein